MEDWVASKIEPRLSEHVESLKVSLVCKVYRIFQLKILNQTRLYVCAI